MEEYAMSILPKIKESKNEIFVVTMYRYGDHDKHSYILGVWSTKSLAELYGKNEEVWRNNKYVAETTKWIIDGNEWDNLIN